MWSAALDSSDLLQSYPVIALVTNYHYTDIYLSILFPTYKHIYIYIYTNTDPADEEQIAMIEGAFADLYQGSLLARNNGDFTIEQRDELGRA